ncbi:MAG: DUF4432 family protein [Gaiellaceae bacterium]
MRSADLLAQGLVSRPDAIAEIRRIVDDPRSGPNGRAYRITVAGGVSVEVLPDRGLDLGSLWFANYPIAWRSPLEVRGAHIDPAGEGWIGRFGGGMLVTCGLDNIGPGREGMGLHGSHHSTVAADVAVRRTAAGGVVVEGVVDSAKVFGRQVYLHRRITVVPDHAELNVSDRVVNEGTTPAAVPILYHLNFGAPFLMPGAQIEMSADRHIAREDTSARFDWTSYPRPTTEVVEAVWEHTQLIADEDGNARARVRSDPLGLTAKVTWNAGALPRCLEWLYPTMKGWALGIEPANAPIFGPDRSGPNAGAPVLEPGQQQETGFTLTLSRSTQPA